MTEEPPRESYAIKYVCMYVCIERLDNSRETITHECIIDQVWGKNGWILAYFKDQDEVEGKNLL